MRMKESVARKIQEYQATADAWASRVVRPAFATLAQHFNQGSDKRSLVVRPDLPQGRQSPEPPRGIGVVSGSPGGRLPVSYRQVGVEVVREGHREFAYYLLISVDEAGIAVRKVVTDADAEQSEANAGVKEAPLPPDISPATLTADTREVLINDFLKNMRRSTSSRRRNPRAFTRRKGDAAAAAFTAESERRRHERSVP